MSNVDTLDEVKKVIDARLKAGEPVAGLQFVNAKGSVGTILSALSARGKLQAEMTCVEGGPNHIRERSDWHQCYLSPEKAKTKPRKSGGPGTGKSMRTPDGTLLRFQDVLPTDSPELVLAKEANNLAFEEAKAAREAAVLAEKVSRQAERRERQTILREERLLAKEAERANKLLQGAKTLREFAASLNVQVSPDATLPETTGNTDNAEV